MNAALQSQIKPPVSPQQLDLPTKDDPTKPVSGSTASAKVDFLKLLNSSNAQAKEERRAKELGNDLEGAKSYQEFLQKLNEKTKQMRTPKNQLDKDDFLKLFVTQLQHQDPLNPEDSTEMASRLAQFNSLEQMLNVNKTLEKMFTAQNKAQSLAMADFVGKEVEIKGGRLHFDGKNTVEGLYYIEKPAIEAKLEIRDESGSVVFSKELGTIPPGEQKINWDGVTQDGQKLGSGVYSFRVVARGINQEEIPVQISSQAKITGIDLKDGSLFTNLGRIKVDDIQSLGEIGFKSKGDQQKPAVPPSEQPHNPMDKTTTPRDMTHATSEPLNTTIKSPTKVADPGKKKSALKFNNEALTTDKVQQSDHIHARQESERAMQEAAGLPQTPASSTPPYFQQG